MKTRSMFRNACILLLVLALAAGTAEAAGGHPYNRNYYPARGQRYYSVPRASVQLSFGGNPYYYAGGSFYRPTGNYFRVAYPPFGIHVNILPPVYHPVIWGGNPYYYADGNFYRQRERDYEVVEAPVGAEVPSLPRDARTIVINGEKFYELNGTYYKDDIRPNGELWYRVMGKNGVVNTAGDNSYNNRNNNNRNDNDYNNRDYNRNNNRGNIPPANNRNDVYRNSTPNTNTNRNGTNRNTAPANNNVNRNSEPDNTEADNTNEAVVNPIPNTNKTVVAENKTEINKASVPNSTKETTSGEAPSAVPVTGGVRTKVTRDDLKKAAPATTGNDTKPITVTNDEETDDQPLVLDKNDLPDNNPTERVNGKPVMGRVFNSLPDNYKVAIINRKKYYVTPDNVYYQEVLDGRVVKYKVVGR